MSAICQNFVQNAWKKELCSNCFKSKDEHNQPPKPKPVAIAPSINAGSILKTTSKSKQRRNVNFTSELTEFIGYGGDQWSDDEEFELSEETFDEDEIMPCDEEEKELNRLTKANTDFNTVSLNDIPDSPPKKTFAQLLLGKPQLDSEGKKQTLLVTVTPFGEDSPSKKSTTKSMSHIPIAKNNKETLTELKSNIVLTSYTKNDSSNVKEEKSLLDEISETLENGKNPIQIVPRKKIQKEIVLTVAKPEANKENIETKKEETKESSTPTTEKKVSIQRTPAIKRDHEKPIFQTSVAKIELLNNKNLKNRNETINATNKFIKTEINKLIQDEPVTNGEIIKKSEETKAAVKNISDNVKSSDVEKSDKEKLVKPVDTTTANIKSTEMKEVSPQSPRELAGEPDGRADPDEPAEPQNPKLNSQPVLENHTSFLHSNTFDKPKIPLKPMTMLIRKPVPPIPIPNEPATPILSTFSAEPKSPDGLSSKLVKHDSNGSDIGKPNKRKAPMPPPNEEISSSSMYLRNSTCTINIDLSSENRERSSSCRNLIGDTLHSSDVFVNQLPEPAPRKSLSMSTDCLNEKKQEKTKGRFSLKRFWRMGASKDITKVTLDIPKNDDYEAIPQPKPRLVIVHPSDLNGEKVEVLAKHHIESEYSNVTYKNGSSTPQSEYAVPSLLNQDVYSQRVQIKPPPPPRNFEDYSNNNNLKPGLPHAPKPNINVNNKDTLTRPKMNGSQNSKKTETVYANIGEVRSAIVPNKPQRTASMREREAQQLKQVKTQDTYEIMNISNSKDSNENVYDYISSARSSSPECDSNPGKTSPTTNNANVRRNVLNQRSESNLDVSGEYFKFQNIPRSVSLTYCGSETESEIYSPYSFYGSESEVAEDDREYTPQQQRTHKLRSRKGRSIVHKNLEDNYGAVIVANHEALAQVLENIQHTTAIQPAWRGLKVASNLRWNDFTIKSIAPTIIGSRAFHQAIWCAQNVTLVVTAGTLPTSSLSLGTFSMTPITEFSDIVPSKYLPNGIDDIKHIQASIAVLPWTQINTIQSYAEALKTKTEQHPEEVLKESAFLLVQLVNSLKVLQAQGIEELPNSLISFVLCKEMEGASAHAKLYVLQGLGEDIQNKNEDKLVSLCSIAANAIKCLMPNTKITPLLKSILDNERAVSLTQVKSVLDFFLWGPSDVVLSNNVKERELAIQRWLDLQRATVLHGLVCAKVQLTVYEEFHLLFLVRSTAKLLCDASLLLESTTKNGLK